MRVGSKLGLYAVAVAGVFGAAAAVGAALGPIDVGASSSHSSMSPTSLSSDVDGFSVRLSGTPTTGESYFTVTVTRDGVPIVTEPYLGAAGHLVVISEDDFAYIHVHAIDGDAGAVRFTADMPSLGRYRLFFDFSVEGEVHTASFTIEVDDNSPATHESHAP